MTFNPDIKQTARTISTASKSVGLMIALFGAAVFHSTACGVAIAGQTEPTPGSAERALESDSISEAEATRQFQNRNYESASAFCLRLLRKQYGNDAVSANKEPGERLAGLISDNKGIRACINLGACYFEMKQYARAERWFELARKILDKTEGSDSMFVADCKLGLAECHYVQGRAKQSIRLYSEALDAYQKHFGLMHPEIVSAMEGLAGGYYSQGDFDSALPLYEHIARIDLIESGPTSLRTGLSLNSLAEVYYQLNDCENSRKMFEQAFWIFKKQNSERILSEFEASSNATASATVKKRINDVVLGTTNLPDIEKVTVELLKTEDFDGARVQFDMRPRDFNNWQVGRRNDEESLFISIDPTVEPKGILVCLHGLGLNSKSFKDFAAKITPFGYGVIALDVRGFGSFAMEKGLDKLDLETGLEDLAASVSLIRAHRPGVPIIVLGESMGGALALQLAAKHPELVDALISAVPSSKRFKSAQTNLLVGFKLIESKKKPIEIGKRVVEQSTADESVRAVWINDPGNRLQLSAEELLRFQNFMKETEKIAKDVKAIPAIIFQGFRDHLVKPEGTIALYGALGTSQKDLVLVGDSEHLIFEEGQAPDDIVRMLAGWLDSHIAVKERLRPSPNPVSDPVTTDSVNASSD
jgi:alpha-beta hydrolase superfamily lysophospholipase